MSSSKINSLDGISQSLVLIGGDRILSGVLRRVCCWWVAAEHQLPDDICVEWSIDSLVVVDQGDELCSHQCKFRFDGSQAGRHLFKFGLGFGITDERLEVLLHTILCTEIKRIRKRNNRLDQKKQTTPLCLKKKKHKRIGVLYSWC